MQRIFFTLILISSCLWAQSFTVEKVSGKVLALKGSGEDYTEVRTGDKLSGSDQLVTSEKSFVQLNREGSRFLLKSNSALGLNSIKKLTVDELLLALASEEIKNVPRQKNNSKTKSTAVYGAENSGKVNKQVVSSDLGLRRLNGARQLAESGFKESSVLVAKETFRKYPETQSRVPDRLYFASIIEKLGLLDEAYAEYNKINSLNLSNKDKVMVKGKIETLAAKGAK